jgi:uncharacterized protein YcfL
MKKYMMGILMLFVIVSLALTGCASNKKVQASDLNCKPAVAAPADEEAAAWHAGAGPQQPGGAVLSGAR